MKFAEVAVRLNTSKTACFPWVTDAKHCRDRFKLVMDKWECMERTKEFVSCGGEKFGELERLCKDIKVETEARKEDVDEKLDKKHERDEKLREAGTTVSDMVMNRRNARYIVVI